MFIFAGRVSEIYDDELIIRLENGFRYLNVLLMTFAMLKVNSGLIFGCTEL